MPKSQRSCRIDIALNKTKDTEEGFPKRFSQRIICVDPILIVPIRFPLRVDGL